MSKLAKQVRSLATTSVANALEQILALWRANRNPELAALIIALGARASIEPINGKTKALASERFVEVAANQKAGELPRLLEAIPIGKIALAKAQIEALSQWPDDPRTAQTLLSMFEAPPYRSRASLEFWQAAIKLVARIGDSQNRVEVCRIIDNIDTRFAAPMARLLKRELDVLRDSLPDAAAAEPTLSAAIGEIQNTLLAASPTSNEGADTLLTAIYADPSDDQLRLVYADACLAANDQRGEAIVIDSSRQSGDRLTREQSKRERAIIATESSKWLGPLERVLLKSTIKFRLGFLDSATIKPKHDTDVRPLIGDPRWSTVRALEIKAVADYHNENAAGARDSVEELICDSVMQSLRRLTGDLSPSLVGELCAGSRKRPLETIAVTLWRDQAPQLLPILANAMSLPVLRELISRQPQRSTPADHAWLFDGSLYSQLKRLELRIKLSALADWFAFFATSSLERLAICDSWAHTRIEFVRDPDGVGLEAKFRYPGDIGELVTLLVQLPPGSLERIEVQWSRSSNAPSASSKAAVAAAVKRLAPTHSRLPSN